MGPFKPASEPRGVRLSGVVGDVWAGGGSSGLGRRVVTPPLVVAVSQHYQQSIPGRGQVGSCAAHTPTRCEMGCET